MAIRKDVSLVGGGVLVRGCDQAGVLSDPPKGAPHLVQVDGTGLLGEAQLVGKSLVFWPHVESMPRARETHLRERLAYR